MPLSRYHAVHAGDPVVSLVEQLNQLNTWSIDAANNGVFTDVGKTLTATHGDTILALSSDREYTVSGTPVYNGRGAIQTTAGSLLVETPQELITNQRAAWAIVEVFSQHTGYLISSTSGSFGWSMRTENPSRVECFHSGGDAPRPFETNIAAGYSLFTPFLVYWYQSPTGGYINVDGNLIRTVSGTSSALGGERTYAIGSLPNGSGRLDGLVYAAGVAEPASVTASEALESLLLQYLAQIKAVELSITTPDLTVFQTDGDAGAATIRARALWTGTGPVTMQYNGGAVQTASLSGDEASHDFVETASFGTLLVEAADGAFSQSITVGAGDAIGVGGQSNAGGTADNVQSYVGATLGAFINEYDAVPVNPLGTSDKSWHPNFITDYTADTGRAVNLVVDMRGSTAIENFRPNAEPFPDPDADQNLFERLVESILKHQLLDPATYDPLTDGPACRAVLWWQGETDAATGTSTADYESALREIVVAIGERVGCPVLVPLLQMLNITYATMGNQSNIRTAQANVRGDNEPGVLGEPNARRGPDWSLVMFDTADGVHIANDTQQNLRAAEWSDQTQSET